MAYPWRFLKAAALVACTGLSVPAAAEPAGSVDPIQVERRYAPGETVGYVMTGVNQGRFETRRYQARAEGVVQADAGAGFVEVFAWKDLQINGAPYSLSPASQAFRQSLSLSPNFVLRVPNLRQVQPVLIGPITDLLAFYADAALAMRQSGLKRAGDHVYFKHGAPNAWADGTYVVFGQDAIDFDMTLQAVNADAQTAILIVRHVPPAEAKLTFPADWMRAPVGDGPNNWAEVETFGDGKFTAEVGRETFEVIITLSLKTGRILSAHMDNPVDVLERDCEDRALTRCAAPTRYRIHREISLTATA